MIHFRKLINIIAHSQFYLNFTPLRNSFENIVFVTKLLLHEKFTHITRGAINILCDI